jgi:dUTP pyrophosphatase
MISSGVAMSIPKGYAGFIFARSGLSTKRGLRPTTCVSVIDADYRGVVGIPLFNDSKEKQIISPHDRISQIIFIKTLKPKIEIVDKFDDNTERGDKGFGSTGR